MKGNFQQERNKSQDPYGKSKIFKAEASDVIALAVEVFAGGNVNQGTIYGDSPLLIALCSETIGGPKVRKEMVSQLLRAKADPNYIHPTEEGNSVAMLFFNQLEASNELHPFVILLAECGADLWIKNDAGLTGRDILKLKYPPVLLALIPGFSIHIEFTEESSGTGIEESNIQDFECPLIGEEAEYSEGSC